MKARIASTLFAAITCLAMAAQAPSFPGAEGHGRYVPGGRGGKVVHVTNLNDSGTGSLRAAVSGNDKKIVVFDVGGVIAMTRDLTIGDNTTIAGQTAPWPGITLRYYTVNPGNNNVIRFIRVRRGQEKDINDGADAIWNRQKSQMIIDHCSFSWSIDEVASFYDNNNFTMQWCTIAESLNNAGHDKGAHGYGGIWGGKLASFHHNLIAHVNNRSPRFNGARYNWTGYTNNQLYSTYNWKNAVQAENVDFRNCVVYNCGNGCYGGPGGGQINMVNNYYKSGPAGSTTRITTISVANSTSSSDDKTYWNMTSRYYISGNQLNSTTNADWNYINTDNGVYTISGELYSPDPSKYYASDVERKNNSSGVSCIRIKMDQPAPIGTVTTHTAAKAFNKVLASAGASLDRDEVDTRYMTEAQNGTATYTGSVTKKKGRIDKVSDVNGYTEANFGTGSRPSGYDTDRDGMPDAWETANGLNPNDASDGATYTLDTKRYYSNLEVYLNSIVQDIMLAGNADAQEAVDEYYPAYTKDDGTKVPAINGESSETPTGQATFTIAASTYVSSPSTTEWLFSDEVGVTNAGGKSYSAGYEDGVKYSANVQYTIQLPADFKATTITFKGYDNYTETDSYIKELGGTTYGATAYVFPSKDGSGNYTVASHTIELASPVAGQLTFTPAGKQVVWAITIEGYYGEYDPGTPAEYTIADDTHTTDPETTVWGFQDDITVSNNGNKNYQAAKQNAIKFSKGVQFTISLPDGFTASSVVIFGYGNEDGNDTYLAELNGTTYGASEYVFPSRTSNQTVTHEVKLATPATGTLTITPKGAQAAWTITLVGTIGGSSPEPLLLGDVNRDGEVNVTDVMLTVNHIFGQASEVFYSDNADVNEDGEVNVTDVMGIVGIVFGNNNN